MRLYTTLHAFAAASLLAGCATLDSLEPGQGQAFTVQGYTYEQVWQAANQATASQLTLVESNKATGVLKAQSPVAFTTWGEVVGVYVSPVTPNASSYSIEVQSLKRARGQITGVNWTSALTESIKAELLKTRHGHR